MLKRFLLLFNISRSNQIARRYFVVNSFDGTLTMLGLLMGFYVSDDIELSIVIAACLGTAIALSVSGISSAYISESAEKKQELKELEEAMIVDLQESAHGQAARFMPFIIAIINGLAPFLFALLIIFPLWLAQRQGEFIPYPLETSMAVAFSLIFFLGVFIGQISNSFWLWAGLRALIIAFLTSTLIYLISLL